MKISSLILILCATVFMMNCSSSPQKTYSNSNNESTSLALTPSRFERSDKPRALAPESSDSNPFSLPASSGTDAGASAAIIGAAILLGSVLHTEAPREDLRGICQYGDPSHLAVTSPCIHVTVNLIDDDKKIHASTETNENGRFRFYIPKGQLFYVQVRDRKGRTSLLNKQTGRGDVVSVLLKP